MRTKDRNTGNRDGAHRMRLLATVTGRIIAALEAGHPRALVSRLRRAVRRRRWPRRPSGRRAHRLTIAEADRILLGLPALERAVYLNVRKGGLSYAMIARRLGKTVDEVETIMARAYYLLVCGFREIEREREE